MASKLIKLTDSNGNILIPAVVSQAVQVKNGSEAVDLQTAYEGIQSLLGLYSGLSASGLENSLTYASYISHTSNTASFTYYFINGNDDVKTNTVTINNVSNATNATNATNAEKLTTGKLTYTGSTGTLTYNFGNGDKNVIILGNANTYGFVKLGTGAGHAATGNHTHTTSVDQSTAVITAGGTSTSGIKGNTSSYGFVKFDTNPTNNSTNAVTSSYIYNSYTYIKNQLNNKAAANHTHDYGIEIIADDTVPDGFTPTGNTVTAVSYFSTETIDSLTDGGMQSFKYAPVSLPTKKYIDDNFVTQTEFETFSASGMHYMGLTGTGTTFNPTNPKQGDVYIVGRAGHGNVISEPNDFIVYNGSSWDVWDKNVTGAMYHGTTALTSGQIVVTDGTAGKVKSVAAPSVSVVSNANLSGTTFPVAINHVFNNFGTHIPFLGYNGGVVTKGTSAQGSGYIGISYTPDHVGSGTAGKLLYWETATKHSAITSTYGSNNSDNIQLHWIDNGVLKNVSVGAGDSTIPTYVDSSGHIKPVTFIDHNLLPADAFINSAKAKFASKNDNTIYTYISPTGDADRTNGSLLKIVQGSNVTITRDDDDQITIASSNIADHIFNSNSTNTNHTGQNGVNPYLKIWGTTSGSALRFTGSNGIKVESVTAGKGLQISHTFSDAAVVTAADLTHNTYYYEATNVTVDDFSLYTFDNTKKYLEGISTTNTTHAYIKGS